ncbi:hypothetical protein [Motilimonas pumila]|uniref:LysM domain-containing protein n=1 Tax=Motilimonas pumila TaxID=2303987 RepID=A0A418YK49_9GAMM|nr:hypothetical protein [Motilimonas pumila]RJG51336.1 hypothetical protein D1Z90_00970 [Motilimonas pumila]
MNKVNKITLSLLPLLFSHVTQAEAILTPSSFELDRSVLVDEQYSQTVDFNAQTLLSFGPNDNNKTGNVSVSADGKSLSLGMNRWQYVEGDFRITAGTVLEFDVLMNTTGEIQGIAFENDLTPTSSSAFKLAGSQNWGISGYRYTELGVVKTIAINVGQHFTGDFNKLVFISDNDNGSSGDITFTNVTLKEKGIAGEPVYQVAQKESWNTLALALYGSMDVAPHLQFLLQDKYQLTPTTKIPFSDLPDVLTTGMLPKPVDADKDGLKDSWELLHFGDLSATADSDHDLDGFTNAQEQLQATNPTAANARLNLDALSSQGAFQVDFLQYPLIPHDNQNDSDIGSMNVLDNGNSIHLVGNRWIALPFDYLVTENTQVQFEIDINVEGEIHGIGFDNDMSVSSNSVFKVAGTQNWGIGGAAIPDPDKPNRFTINVGQYLQGHFKYLLIIADDDANKQADAIIRNLKIIEQDETLKRRYEVQAGDSWESISAKLYNDTKFSDILKNKLGNIFLLEPSEHISQDFFPAVISELALQHSADWDNDGIPNILEHYYLGDPLNPFDPQDPDSDGLSRLAEFQVGSDPESSDSDSDGVLDGEDFAPTNAKYRFDQDKDGMPDAWELQFGFDLNNPDDAKQDVDGDGLTNLQEFKSKLSPVNPDSDYDMVDDGSDIAPLNPLYRFDSTGNGTPDLWQDSYLRMREFDQNGEDHDGLSLLAEFIAGTNPIKADSDGDGIDDGLDAFPLNARYIADSDQDGLPDQLEAELQLNPFIYFDSQLDLDDDFLSNIIEFTLGTSPTSSDTDNDRASDLLDFAPLNPNYRYDSDADGIPSQWEELHGFDDFVANDAHDDPDGDGLTNKQEFDTGTNPRDPDSDKDGVLDDDDIAPLNPDYSIDTDRDGLPFEWEIRYGLDEFRNDLHEDPDGDYLNNWQEFLLGTNPVDADTDNDGVPDDQDFMPLNPKYSLDADNDGLPQKWEEKHGFNDNDKLDSLRDEDADGLTNLQEFQLSTEPKVADSDNDGVLDGEDVAPLNSMYSEDYDRDGLPYRWEITYGFNDFDPTDSQRDEDADGLTNLQEFQLGTNPREADSDKDGALDKDDPFPLNSAFSFDDDADGLPLEWEQQYGLLDTDRFDAQRDDDYDGLTNLQEFKLGTNPGKADSDLDGVIDSADIEPTNSLYSWDRDQDGIPWVWELQYKFSDEYAQDASQDFDMDGLTNQEEFILGTNPHQLDTDRDGVSDRNDFAPLNPAYTLDYDKDGVPLEWEELNHLNDDYAFDAKDDYDSDLLSNKQEFELGTNPFDSDTDRDGIRDNTDFAPTNPRYTKDEDNDGIPLEWELQFGLSDTFAPDAVGDDDGDMLTNLQEFKAGTDPRHPDSDQDGAWDGEDIDPMNAAFTKDEDRDGLPLEWELQYGLSDNDRIDAFVDSDGDNLFNLQEFALGTHPQEVDTDKDGVWDFEDSAPTNSTFTKDEDGDGLPLEWEVHYGYSDLDKYDASWNNDGDKLTNLQEFKLGTNPNAADSDSDNFNDDIDDFPLNAKYFIDDDLDGLPYAWELEHGLKDYDAVDSQSDLDNDGLSNYQEFELGTSPINMDTDGDRTPDSQDPMPLDPRFNDDTDNDGLPLQWELLFASLDDLNPTDADADFDSDGLTNIEEFKVGTHPELADSDGDGVIDGEDVAPTESRYQFDRDNDGLPDSWERQHGFNDMLAFDALTDPDLDGLNNLQEFKLGTDPRLASSDGDFAADGEDVEPLNPERGLDSDFDGLPWQWESNFSLSDLNSFDASFDTDNDGLTNYTEYLRETDPTLADTDSDGWLDQDDAFPTLTMFSQDMDLDGLPDQWEVERGLNPVNPTDAMQISIAPSMTYLAEFRAMYYSGVRQ